MNNDERTVIGSTTIIENDTCVINCGGDLEVRGTVRGLVNCAEKVTVYQGSTINGDINAKNVDINSNVNGNINVREAIALHENSVVNGNITSATLSVDSGAVISGNVQIKRD